MPDANLTAGGALLRRLKILGIDFVLGNAGTDFPPLIEAMAEAQQRGHAHEFPEPVVVPHEHAAMSMAHGYYIATGKPLAVIAHTNVGLANCIIGGINAACDRVPILLFSGRTPITERGRPGSRSIPIGWGQEMRDQAGMLRELVKWDYELRFPEQVPELVDRMHAIALSTPPGPVYMSLPREVLADACPGGEVARPVTMRPAAATTPPERIREAAGLIAAARHPVIFAQTGPRTRSAFETLATLADRWAIPVVQYWGTQPAIPTRHPMWAASEPAPWLEEADVALVLDSLVPWNPDTHAPRPDCRIVQIGPDPLHARFPVRNFRTDLALVGTLEDIVPALAAAMPANPPGHVAHRRSAIARRTTDIHRRIDAAAEAGGGAPMSKAWVARCLSDALASRPGATVVSELGVPMDPMRLDQPLSFVQAPHAGGLGWGFPAALGIQLADRDRLVVAAVGDGSYIFSNPTACHQLAEALRLPVLVLVLNNTEWGAVRRAVNAMYPGGAAAKANRMPFTSLAPCPDFTQVAAASRCRAERVEKGSDLPDALRRALDHVATRREPALLDLAIAV